MKVIKVNILLWICLLSLILGACEDFLESRDKGQVLEEKLFVNQEGVEEAMYGLYYTLGTTDLWGAHLPVVMDCLAQYFTLGNYSSENAGGFEELMLHNHDSERSTTLFGVFWTMGYKLISDINKVLENLDNWKYKPLKHMNLYRGECLGLRAFMHFELLRMYGSCNLDNRGIPYVTNYGMWVSPFSKTGDCYDKILADLKEAHMLLAEDENLLTYPRAEVNAYDQYSSYREVHMNLYAVKALLARVFLTRNQVNDLDSAATYARQIVESKKFPLPQGNEISPEHFIRMMSGTVAENEAVFGVYKSDTYSALLNLFLLETGSFLPADEKMYEVLESEKGVDFRSNWIRVPLAASQQISDKLGIRLMKLINATAFNSANREQSPIGYSGLNLIRIPELYLMLAEILLEKEQEEALRYYNDFIYSRGFNRVENVTKKDIDHQFWREYIQEGQYWFRLKRFQVSEITVEPALAVVKGVKTIKMDESKWNLPIPDSEFEFREEGSY